MKKNCVVLVLLSMLLLLGFAGCDQDTQALVENLASPYEKVSLRDLGTFAPSDTEDDWLDTDLLGPEISLLEDGFMLLGGLSEFISSPPFGTAFNPRSIFAGLQLSIKDEGFDFTYKKIFPPNAEESSLIYSADIDYMDLILTGEINSLSKLVAFLAFDDTEKLAALTADGNIKLSAKMKASTNDFYFTDDVGDYVSAMSIFADLSITGSASAGQPTGLLSGRLQFSIGSNLVVEYLSGGNTIHRTPVIIQCEIAPFSNVDIAALQEALGLESAKDTPDMWSVYKKHIWNNADGNLLTITRIIGKSDATAVIGSATWTNEAAFNLFSDSI